MFISISMRSGLCVMTLGCSFPLQLSYAVILDSALVPVYFTMFTSNLVGPMSCEPVACSEWGNFISIKIKLTPAAPRLYAAFYKGYH